ncbi:MAG: DUF3237 family protein [Aquabacterium sp.]
MNTADRIPDHPDLIADHNALRRLAARQPVETPGCRLLWHAAVAIGEREGLGRSPLGERFIVPILGGAFWGAEGFEALHGTVRAGGADRQLLRADGVKELDALYEMQVHDGTVLTVHNRVTIDESVQPRYARSQVAVTAPDGPWAWLSRRRLVGTLQPLRPEAAAVLVRVFEVV